MNKIWRNKNERSTEFTNYDYLHITTNNTTEGTVYTDFPITQEVRFVEDILAVSDEGKMMPPKSTLFEPKLLSSLFVYDLESEKSNK